MTFDDESSIYVGGIPYDATEDTLRRVFDSYGAVLAVKIVNDHGTKGKCYGFVTFRNPRSAINAIDDMDGRTIGGRVVRVNGVMSRGERSGFERGGFQRRSEMGRDRVRGRKRDYNHDGERFRDRSDERSSDHERSREYDFETERGVEINGLSWDGDLDRDHNQDGGFGDSDRGRNWERDPGSDSDRAWEIDRNNRSRSMKTGRDRRSRKYNGSISTNGRHSRELSSNSNNENIKELKEQLQTSTERLEELKKEILSTEEKIDESGTLVSVLQQKSKKLEELLINAKKTSSLHKTKLTKLHKCFLQVRDHAEKAKISEKELQSIVDGSLSLDVEST